MSDLQAYLASKYMTGAKAEAILDRAGGVPEGKRRKKRKVESLVGGVASGSGSTSGMVIADDNDESSWKGKGGRGVGEDEEEEGRPVVEERRGHFKSKASNSWATVRPSDPSLAPTPSPEPEDDLPVVVNLAPVSRGGLQSAADLRAENDRRAVEVAAKKKQAEREFKARRAELKEDEEDPSETVYRDSSGRKIDTKREKAEMAKRKRDELESEMKKMEWGKGVVQKEDKARRKREEEAMKARPIARYADDKDMNNEMKDVDRWNDPAAGFLTKKKVSKSSAPKMPSYTGPAPPPNRFGIPPGYRWDGVDRSTGFEKTMGQAGNARKMRDLASFQYGREDM